MTSHDPMNGLPIQTNPFWKEFDQLQEAVRSFQLQKQDSVKENGGPTTTLVDRLNKAQLALLEQIWDLMRGIEHYHGCQERFARFFNLPYELRRGIYLYLLPGYDVAVSNHVALSKLWVLKNTDRTPVNKYYHLGHCRDVEYHMCPATHWYMGDFETWLTLSSIILVSRQMKEEVLNLLYGENWFSLDVSKNQEVSVSHSNLQRVRKLKLSSINHYNEGMKFLDEGLWSTILPFLDRLELSFEQPGFIGDYIEIHYNVELWLEWLRSFLKCLSRFLPEGCEVVVNDNWEHETNLVIKECLKGSVEFKRLLNRPPGCQL